MVFPELHQVLILALITAGVGAAFIVLVKILPAILNSEFYRANRDKVDLIARVVGDTVLRLAVNAEDLSAFEDEAAATGRDVRLVAAIHWIDAALEGVFRVKIDENYIVSQIEARLEEFKRDGLIPRNTVQAVSGAQSVVEAQAAVTTKTVRPRRKDAVNS